MIKPTAPWLTIAKLDYTSVKSVLGVNNYVQVPDNLWQLCCVAFICGYSDSHTFISRGVFSTMMTGNLVIVFDALEQGAYGLKYLGCTLAALFGFIVFGIPASFYAMRSLKSWHRSLNPILIGLLFVSAFEALNEAYDPDHTTMFSNFTLMLYCGAIGSLSFWSSKSGYLLMLHTGNLMKVLEFILKYFCGYNLGDAKAKGDVYVCARLIMSFLGGVITSAFSYKSMHPATRLLPCMVIIIVLIFLVRQNAQPSPEARERAASFDARERGISIPGRPGLEQPLVQQHTAESSVSVSAMHVSDAPPIQRLSQQSIASNTVVANAV